MRWFLLRNISIVALVLSVEAAISSSTARGQDIFVTNAGNSTIGEYTTSGGTVNASLVSGLYEPWGLAVSGSDLFFAGSEYGTIGEYTTSGGTVNPSLVTGLSTPTGHCRVWIELVCRELGGRHDWRIHHVGSRR